MAVTNLSIQVKTNAVSAANRIQKLIAALESVKDLCGTYNISFNANTQDVTKIKSELAAAVAEAQGVERATESMLEGADRSSAAFGEVKERLESALMAAEGVEEAVEEMDGVSEATAAAVSEVKAELEEAVTAAETVEQAITSTAEEAATVTTAAAEIKEEFQETEAAAEGAEQAIEEIAFTGENINVETLDALRAEAEAAEAALSEEAEATEEVSTTSQFASKAVATLKTALSAIGSKLISGITSSFHSMGASLTSLAQKMQSPIKWAQSLFKSLWRLTKLRIMRGLLRSITSGVSEGAQNLYYYSQALNGIDASSAVNTLDALATNLQYLKNSVGAAFGSLIATLTPIINQICDMLVEAINYVNMFFAILGGRDTYTKAVKVAATYADDAADSTSSAAASAKELKATLLGIDEINKLNDNDTSSGTGGSGSDEDAVDYTTMFEEAAINSGILSAFKDALTMSDWTELGELLADKLNAMIYSINDWLPGFEQACKKWGKRIATLLNGLIDGLDASALGTTVKGFMNSVLEFLYTAVDNFDFKRLGEQIGTMIESALSDLSIAQNLGKTIAAWFTGKWKAALALIKKSNLGNLLGYNIAELINSAFGELDTSYGEFLGTMYNTVFDLIDKAVGNIDWGAIGSTILKNIIKMFDKMDSKKVASAIRSVFDAAVGLVGSIGENFDELLSSALEWIVGAIVDWVPAILEGIGKLAGEIVKNLPSILKGILEYLANDFGADLVGIISSIGTGLLSGVGGIVDGVLAWFEVDSDIAGALENFGDMISGISDTAGEKLKQFSEDNEAAAEAAAKIYANAAVERGYYEQLLAELESITDANGAVKAGYEERAEYILTELGSVCDTEFQLIDGVVQEYNSLKEAVQNATEARKRAAQIEAEEEIYNNAVDNIDAARALYESLTAQYELAEASWEAYLAQPGAYTAEQVLTMANGLQTTKQQLEEASTEYQNYLAVIAQYESDYTNYVAGNYEGMTSSLAEFSAVTQNNLSDMISYYDEYLAGLETDYNMQKEIGTEASLAKAEETASEIESIKNLRDEAKAQMDKMASDEADSLWASQNHYDELKSVVEGYVNDTSGSYDSLSEYTSDYIEDLKGYMQEQLDTYDTTGDSTYKINAETAAKQIELLESSQEGMQKIYEKMTEDAAEGAADIGEEMHSSLGEKLSQLASDAWSWGADICQSIANGISSAVGWVTSAASDVAGWIKSFLGFSEPEKGPLSDFHTYMPDMLSLMAEGIKSNAGTVVAEVAALAADMAEAAVVVPDVGTLTSSVIANATISGDAAGAANTEEGFGGIADAVYTSSANEVSLLQSVERLLEELLEKDTNVTVSTADIGKGFTRANRRAGRTIYSMG